ncbi:hypothetical protein TNCV_2141081 [Trichonephila clavipes]|uniref:Uncharacterized protein n=1 Tax=Trichonephila clavipes TaxID=2585209 RepID=A0A8X6RU90_TRICX|nr:hypothetical protein TNCV_2141081 [Trichonephila clavipes]
MPLSRMLNSTFAMPNIIDSHDMGLRTVLQSRRPKRNGKENWMKRKEKELDERKRKERELAERKRKEEMEIAERKRRADFEQKMRDIEMEFEIQKKLIELEGEGHFTRACLDIEVSTNRGNIGKKRSEI